MNHNTTLWLSVLQACDWVEGVIGSMLSKNTQAKIQTMFHPFCVAHIVPEAEQKAR